MIETYRGVAFPWLCDQQGHLTTSQYVMMFDVAAYHLLDRLDRGEPAAGHLGWADVRQEIDYKAEVAVGALVLIRSGLVKLGRTSITTRHLMTSTDGGIEHAALQAISVRFDKQARAAVPLPDAFRSKAASLLI